MSSDLLSIINIGVTTIAVLLSPIIALWVGEKLRERSEQQKAKLHIFATLVANRYDPLAPESMKALHLIDVVFADDHDVREAWNRFYVILHDTNFNNPPGWALREDRRRELILAMVKALKWRGHVSTADLLRTYQPTALTEMSYHQMITRVRDIGLAREQLKELGIADPMPGYVFPTQPQVPPQLPQTQPEQAPQDQPQGDKGDYQTHTPKTGNGAADRTG